MSELAVRPMSLAEFLRWEDGTDTRYELVGGFPLAMAPPAEAHRMLATRLASRIDAALAGRRPCNAQIEAGIVRLDRADSYFVADIAATCTPNERRRQAIKDPILIVEILSPGTERHDRLTKVPVYRSIDSVRRDPADRFREHLCRGAAPGRRPMDHHAGARSRRRSSPRLGGFSRSRWPSSTTGSRSKPTPRPEPPHRQL